MLIFISAEGTETTAEAAVLLIPAGQSVKLDGSLSEPFWEQAAFLGPLTMVEPKEGASASERTDIKVLATAEAVYIGVICFDREPSRIVSSTMQRDAELRGEDHIKIVLDTFLNGRTGYVFGVNPDGARYDALIEKEGQSENHQWGGTSPWRASGTWDAYLQGRPTFSSAGPSLTSSSPRISRSQVTSSTTTRLDPWG